MLLLTSRAAVEGEFAAGARTQGDAIVTLGCIAVGASFFVARSTAGLFACRGRRDGALEKSNCHNPAIVFRETKKTIILMI